MSKNLAARLIVAALAIPVVLWICYRGGGWLFGMVLVFALMALGEFLFNEGFRPRQWAFWLSILTLLTSLGWSAAPWILDSQSRVSSAGMSNLLSGILPLLVFFIVSAMAFSLGKQPPADLFRRHTRLFWGVAYVTMLYPFVFRLGMGFDRFHGGDCLLFLFALLWVGDTAAMGIGKWLGRHKLAPAVSPNKTVEGFVGGIVGALAVGVLMYFWKFQALSFGQVLIVAAGCSVFGQLGDLVESMWKRSLKIKDSSALIPGHGGVLDRFDSLLFAAPFMYGYFRLFVATG